VVRLLFHVLHFLLEEEVHGLLVEVAVDPRGNGPVLSGDKLCVSG
jgi:hypothetical protein